MASVSIEKISRKNSVKFKARVRLTHKGKRLFEQSKTFANEKQAKAWGEQLGKQLDSEGVPQDKNLSKTVSIGDLITEYLNDPITSADIGRSKYAVLSRLRAYKIALVRADLLTANDLVNHCRTRKGENSNPLPQTIYHDVTYLKSVIDVAGPMFGYVANTRAHDEAIPTLVRYGLIGRSQRRERRPSKNELKIMERGLARRQSHRCAHIPLVDIFHLSILTCMCLGEITRIAWDDINFTALTLTIRDRKDPRNKRGNNCIIPLFPEAKAILERQPRNCDRVFPFKKESIGAAWQRVCKEEGIEDLRYHDLRAEGACQLLERGLSIVEVSKITGHKDINVLNNVYLRLNIQSIHQYKNNTPSRSNNNHD
ncbi:site-specific integrase [Vibrio parahaemolyticus]|uniref:site-specific integrase n=1 Tax=Vibrio parahaemolyticus TaxID=670 RepID=UPI0004230F26|nr:site-specific integrase [Vibrio parahaemolyticus]EJG1730942.1 site-specific integrase [Vibrio parahaemolyticus]HCH1896218.1 site-specific integrase [Vibrio parahaemolyticus]HCH2964958.1 site-specific integrase [Vibrio parahaemolyticus]HCM1140873.1 site-specific integrase [Vibrio parahaemolyticus]HCM1433528.1 site-specific integrase [Vibrio parahaemolyticus]